MPSRSFAISHWAYSRCRFCSKVFIDSLSSRHPEYRKVLNLRVQCPNFSLGCPFTGVLSDLSSHTDACSFARSVCPLCRDVVALRRLQSHTSSECLCRDVTCEHCLAVCPFEELKSHLSKFCPELPVGCPHKCGVAVQPRRSMLLHLELQCQDSAVACVYAHHGCKERVLRRDMEVRAGWLIAQRRRRQCWCRCSDISSKAPSIWR